MAKSNRKLNGTSWPLSVKSALAVLLFGAALAVMSGLWIPRQVDSVLQGLATREAIANVNQIKTLRGYYTRNIITPVLKSSSLSAHFDHKGDDATIPLPATLVHDLSQEFSEVGRALRLYSPYPFPNRASQKLDRFEEAAWRKLNIDPNASLSDLETVDGRSILRVAVSDVMSAASCVSCHNTHPDTPKADWKIGDVRGVLEIKIDMTENVQLARQLGWMVAGVIALFALVGSVGIATYLQRKIVGPIESMSQAAQRFSKNDTDTKVYGTKRKDEIGALARSLEVFRRQAIQLKSLNSIVMKQSENLERTVDERTKALVEAKAVAEDATKAKSEFLATMSHEIRTPMNGVLTMAQILDETRLNTDQMALTRTIRQSSEALLTIINDILDFSKIEAGKLSIERVHFDLLEQIEGVADLIAPKAEAASLLLVVDLDDMMPGTVVGDPTRLRQILLNLTGNAIKFTEMGSVVVRLRHVPSIGTGYRMRFEVTDTGIGMNEEQVKNLFKAFTQADNSTARKFGGTGLGLVISKQLVELMGGEIGVISSPNEGSTFWFELPLEIAKDDFVTAPYDLGAATVMLVGYDAMEASSLERSLRLGGVGNVLSAQDEGSLDAALDFSNIDLLLLNGRPGIPSVVEWARIVPKRLNLDHPNALVTAPHMALSALQMDQSNFPEERLFGTMQVPVHTRRLWDYVAVALGLRTLESLETASRDSVTFDPPDHDTARNHKAMLLVAEDNPTNQIVIARVLNRLGVAHEMASDGKAALELLAERPFDMLLSDFHMPMMDGFELTRSIRQAELELNHKRLPIVALTADVLPETAARCEEVGMDGYLRKPIEIDRLEDILRTFIPAAFEIRRVAMPDAQQSEAPADDHDHSPRSAVAGIDPDIFNPDALNDAFGEFDQDASDFVLSFLGTVKPEIDAINTAFEKCDFKEVRARAHAMKGASTSTGAVRLGRLMGDIQDCLDDDDPDTADIYRDGLVETYEELNDALAKLRR